MMKKFSLAWLMMGIFVAASICGLVVFNQKAMALSDRNTDLQKQILLKQDEINLRDQRLVATGKGAALLASLATDAEKNKDVLEFIRSIEPDSLCIDCNQASAFDNTLPDELEIYFCHQKRGVDLTLQTLDGVGVEPNTLQPTRQAFILFDQATKTIVDSLLFDDSTMYAMSPGQPFEITVLRSNDQRTYTVAATGFQGKSFADLAPPCSYTPSPYDNR